MNRHCGKFGLMLARVAVAAWVGAATLFVINGVRLVASDAFDSVHRDHMALIRFPPYYVSGAVCMGLAVTGWMLARNHPGLGPVRWTIVVVLLLLASSVLACDYAWIYSPLAEMITPPGSSRPAGFVTLHRASEIVNGLQWGLCLVAAGLVSWPTDAAG